MGGRAAEEWTETWDDGACAWTNATSDYNDGAGILYTRRVEADGHVVEVQNVDDCHDNLRFEAALDGVRTGYVLDATWAPDPTDTDLDGYGADTDCDDSDPDIHPCTVET